MAQQAAEQRCLWYLPWPQAKSPDGNGTMCWEKSSQNVCSLGKGSSCKNQGAAKRNKQKNREER